MIFINYNVNPKNYKAGDCVVRSISTALNQDWYKTFDELCEVAKKKCRMPNDRLVYKAYLKIYGFLEMASKKHPDGRKFTIKDVIEASGKGNILVINCTGHVTVAIDGYLIDTWDCSSYAAGKYWLMPIKDKDKINKQLDYIMENSEK